MDVEYNILSIFVALFVNAYTSHRKLYQLVQVLQCTCRYITLQLEENYLKHAVIMNNALGHTRQKIAQIYM